MRLTLSLLLALGSSAAAAQSSAPVSKWRFEVLKDDFSGKSDQRLILDAEENSPDRLGDSTRARLILACGKIYRGHGGKTLMFDAGIPIEAYQHTLIADIANIQTRSDLDEKPKNRMVQIYDRGNTMVYLGDSGGFFFSKSIFQSMLGSTQIRIRFTPLLGNTVETVTFDVRGLAGELPRLDQCEWPSTKKP